MARCAPAGACRCPLFPGFDTLGTLAHIMQTGHDYTWFVLTQKMIEREFALSGSEQNPDLTGRSIRKLLASRVLKGAPGAGRGVQAPRRGFHRRARSARTRAADERCWPSDSLLDAGELEREIVARDRELRNPFTKDARSPRSTARAGTSATA